MHRAGLDLQGQQRALEMAPPLHKFYFYRIKKEKKERKN